MAHTHRCPNCNEWTGGGPPALCGSCSTGDDAGAPVVEEPEVVEPEPTQAEGEPDVVAP